MLRISAIASRGIILSMQWTTKALIRLRGCAGWSAPLLFASGKSRCSHDEAQLLFWVNIYKEYNIDMDADFLPFPIFIYNLLFTKNSYFYDASSCGQHYLQYIHNRWGLRIRTPSMLRAGYPTLLTWRGKYDLFRLKTIRLPHAVWE